MATYESYPLNLPTNVGIKQSSWKLKRAVAVSTSPFTGAQQVQEYDYSLWQATISLPPMKRENAAAWQAFFLKLHGRLGTFLLGDPDAKEPRGVISGSVTVATDAAVGSHEVEISTSLTNTANIFRAGDYIQFGSDSSAKLHMIVEDVDTDASGDATLVVEPIIKVPVTSSTAVTYSNPKGQFRMDASELGWDADHVSRYGMSFSCTEAF